MRRLAMLPLEKMSDPMQGLYADLRHQYPLAAIELTPEDGIMVVTFTDGPTVRINETPKGLFRVRATRQVPAGKRTKDVEQARTAKDARAVLYAIDGFLVEEPKVAHVGPKSQLQIKLRPSNQVATWERTLQHTVRSFRTIIAEASADHWNYIVPDWQRQVWHTDKGDHPVNLAAGDMPIAPPSAYEQIAHMFIDSLGANPDQLSSQQLGDRMVEFIRGPLRSRWDSDSVTPEMWADIGRLLGEHGIHMDERDFNSAIDRTS